ncbi:MAG: MG2 domain-containing protein [Flavobacteriales bacterium]
MRTVRQLLYPIAAGVLLATCANERSVTTGNGLRGGDARWAAIDSLSDIGQYATALGRTEAILADAREQGDWRNEFRAWLYKGRFEQLTGVERSETLRTLEQRAAIAEIPLRQLLRSMIGEAYWQWYQSDRWRILERTEVSAQEDMPESDPTTWTQRQFMAKIVGSFEASLEPSDTLEQIPVADLEGLLSGADGAVELRPTLFDLLGRRALDVFSNPETRLTEPAWRFKLDDPAHFDLFEPFAFRRFTHRDSTAWEYKALLTYQALERSHLADDTPAALTDIVLDRLAFVRDHSTLPEKDSLYINALTTLRTRLVRIPAWSEVSVAMARYHAGLAARYDPLVSDAWKGEKSTARELCVEAITRAPGSFGAKQAASLKAALEAPALSVQVEEATSPNAVFIAALQYTNAGQVWLRLVKDPFEATTPRRWDHDHGAWLAGQKPVAEWSLALPDDGDLNTHRVEIPVKALPVGRYALLVSNDPGFEPHNDVISHATFWCTDLAIVERRNTDAMDVLVVQRNTGAPVEGAKVVPHLLDFDRSAGRRYVPLAQLTTDKEGMVHWPDKGRRGEVLWRVDLGEDSYSSEGHWVYRNEGVGDPDSLRTFLFTDRAIYRPGQDLHFKGIVTVKRGGTTVVKAGHSTRVAFYDVNGDLVDSALVRTDPFGSFSGTFKTPMGRLTGGMRLQEPHGSAYFRVEEYKRPSFEVVMDPVTGSPRLGQEAVVSGVAKSYAGAPLDGASVQWNVKRGARMPWWCGWAYRGLPWGRATEIASGTAVCDAQGRFEVRFAADADRAFPRDADPVFFYTVEVAVVDITGETRTGSTTLNVGHRSVEIEIGGPGTLDRSSTDSLDIRVRNLNGEEVDRPMHIRIVELVAPADAPVRERLWERPDRTLDGTPVKNDDPRSWTVKQVHFDRKDVRAQGHAIELVGVARWTVGMYRVEVSTTDPEGVPLKVERTLTIYDPEIQNTGFLNEAFHLQPLKTTVEPGQDAVLLLSSALPEGRVMMEVERAGKIVVNRRFMLKKEQQRLEIPVLEADRGGFAVHFVCVERGRIHRITQRIEVPWSNKELHMEWSTFRDKLLPGQQEEWRLRITGPRKEQVAAQLLAVMYDASLDRFMEHHWQMPLWPTNITELGWSTAGPFGLVHGQDIYGHTAMPRDTLRSYPVLKDFGYNAGYGRYRYFRGARSGMDGAIALEEAENAMDADMRPDAAMAVPAVATAEDDDPNAEKASSPAETQAGGPSPVRSDFRETAFFFPDLLTDRDGAIMLRFKTPDALTRWNVMGLAHTKDLKSVRFSERAVTRKPMMVVPNLPRFLRVGDRITVVAKINVLEGAAINGTSTIELFDPATNGIVTDRFKVRRVAKDFTAAPGASATVSWELEVPEQAGVLGVRIAATASGFGDGEERVLPILTDKVLVTESLPLSITKAGTKTFELEKLVNANSTTLKHQSLKLEFTPNPAWYAVQALPYLMEFPHECSEQTFSRYYANRLAGHIVEERPAVKEVFEQWKEAAGPKATEGAFLSALEKNPELKGVLLEETPWVIEAKDEGERKRRIALYFDLQRMAVEEAAALKKLQDMQLPNGAWPWWSGMRESRYITQHILAGLGHLEHLKAADLRADGPVQRMLRKAVEWTDADVDREFKELQRRSTKAEVEEYVPNAQDIQLLYARSFFDRWPARGGARAALDFYTGRLASTWLTGGLQQQAMAAIVLARSADRATAQLIMRSLSERATRSEELGMYWKDFTAGFAWYEFPTETHALLIEAFHEVTADTTSVNALRQYLLKLKQTTYWKTTKATAEACYALLLTGDDLLGPTPAPVITVGDRRVDVAGQEAGTGHFDRRWAGEEVRPAMGRVTVTASTDGVQWGALHWQYLERMDKVTAHAGPFRIDKKVMLQERTDAGSRLIALPDARPLKVGDELTVRIELRTDRYVDLVHLKDLRAAGLEPVEAISGYRWQGGLGYYQSIRDAGMHFFFDRIAPGTYVFEYDLRVNQAGDFSNGITTAMCMYAPEFSSHSQGERVKVDK